MKVEWNLFRKKLTGSKLFDFYKTLSLFDKNSVPIVQGIQYLSESDPKNQIYKKMLQRAANTSKLSNILEGFIPDKDLDYFKVAEGHGGISTMLIKLEELQQLEMKLIKDLYAIISMPVVMLLASLAIIAGYGSKVLPAFEKIIPMDEWPFLSYSMVGIADFLMSFKSVFFVIFLGFLFNMFIKYLKNDNSILRGEVLDKFPIFRLYKSILAFTFLNKFSFLVAMGIGYHDALKLINAGATGRMKYFIDKMIVNSGDNSNVEEVIDVGLIESQDVVLMGMFAKQKSFDTAINVAVDRCTNKLQNEMALGGSTIKYVMLVVIALVILWTYLSVNLLVMTMI